MNNENEKLRKKFFGEYLVSLLLNILNESAIYVCIYKNNYV